MGYSPWGRKESDMTQHLSTHTQCHRDAEQALPLVGLISTHSDQSLWSFKKEKVRSLKQWVSTLPVKTPDVISSQI